MAVYALGDLQGCYDALRRLLDQLHFDPAVDRLWFTGDLVNRGPQSLEVLRYVQSLGDRAVTVLGNHDLHLLAVACGVAAAKPRDTLDLILAAPDRDSLLEWLATRPLLHHDPQLNYTLVHAGLVPQWDLALAMACAEEARAVLLGPERAKFLAHMYGDTPDQWHETLQSYERWRFIVNVFTRLRYCDAAGCVDLRYKGSPGTQPASLVPWFKITTRRSQGLRIVFGHWSLLDLWNADGVIGLDTGCFWGRRLTAVRLDVPVPEFFSVPCRAGSPPA